MLPLSDAVVARAVSLRQERKTSLGDALIAATALVFGRELLTRNVKDFVGIPGLVVSTRWRMEIPNRKVPAPTRRYGEPGPSRRSGLRSNVVRGGTGR